MKSDAHRAIDHGIPFHLPFLSYSKILLSPADKKITLSNSELISELMITEGNNQKSQTQ